MRGPGAGADDDVEAIYLATTVLQESQRAAGLVTFTRCKIKIGGELALMLVGNQHMTLNVADGRVWNAAGETAAVWSCQWH